MSDNRELYLKKHKPIHSFNDNLLNYNQIGNSKRKRILCLIIFYLLFASVSVIIIGQLPTFSSSKFSIFFKLFWLLLLIPILILDYKLFIRSFFNIVLFISPFLLYCFVSCIFGVKSISYWGTINLFIISSITVISIFFRRYFNNHFLKSIAFSFVITSVIYGLLIYILYLRGNIWQEQIYVFNDKNSAGPIFLTAAILSFYVFDKDRWQDYFLKISIFCMFSVLLLIAKCRASIICVPLILCIIHLFLPKTPKSKLLSRIIFPIAMVGGITLIFTVPSLKSKIIDHFLLNDKSSIQDAFSGRIEQIFNAFKLFKGGKTILIGLGSHYIDCFPISLILSYGIIGFLTLIPILILPWYALLKTRKNNNSNLLFLIKLSVLLTIYISGFFEGYGVFGPGAKVFFMWIITGFNYYEIIISHKKSIIKKPIDAPSMYLSSIKSKPFTFIFQTLIVTTSVCLIAIPNVVNQMGNTIYEMLPVNNKVVSAIPAKNMKINTDLLANNLDFKKQSDGRCIGTICEGQKIQLNIDYDNKDVANTYYKAWYTTLWDPSATTITSCKVDKDSGVLTAIQSEGKKECIVLCSLSNKDASSKKNYLQVKVTNQNEYLKNYKFKHTKIDIFPFKYSFDLSDQAKNSSEENPISIFTGEQKRLFYDTNYLTDGSLIEFKSSDKSIAKIDNNVLTVLKEGDFNVYGIIKNDNNIKTNILYFRASNPETQIINVEQVDFKFKQKPEYKNVPYKYDVVFTDKNGKTSTNQDYDVSFLVDGKESDNFSIDKNKKEITFKSSNEDIANVSLKIVSRSNTKVYNELPLSLKKNPVKSIECDGDRWCVIGNKYNAEQLGLKISFENGFKRVLDDSDLYISPQEFKYSLNDYRSHQASTYKNGLCDNKFTSFIAVKTGQFTYNYVSKENPNITYKLNVSCNVNSYSTYKEMCTAYGLIVSYVIISLLSLCLFGIITKHTLTYILITIISSGIVIALTILLHPLNGLIIVCVGSYSSLILAISLIRIIFLKNKNVPLIEEIPQQ